MECIDFWPIGETSSEARTPNTGRQPNRSFAHAEVCWAVFGAGENISEFEVCGYLNEVFVVRFAGGDHSFIYQARSNLYVFAISRALFEKFGKIFLIIQPN